MDEHTDVTLAAAHRPGDLVDGQVSDDAEQHCLGHVWRQPAHQCDGSIECADIVERPGTGFVGASCDGIVVDVFGTPSVLAGGIDLPAASDREQPSPERVAVTAEAVERSGDVDPHLGRQILGLGAATTAEVAQQHVLMGSPQGTQRVAITRTCTLDPLVHRNEYRSFGP